jgi:Transcriptional regulator PadR-like family
MENSQRRNDLLRCEPTQLMPHAHNNACAALVEPRFADTGLIGGPVNRQSLLKPRFTSGVSGSRRQKQGAIRELLEQLAERGYVERRTGWYMHDERTTHAYRLTDQGDQAVADS